MAKKSTDSIHKKKKTLKTIKTMKTIKNTTIKPTTNIIDYLYKRNLLKLKPIMENKKFRAEHVNPFYNEKKINLTMKLYNFYNDANISINEQIWNDWKDKKEIDLYIISFKTYKINMQNYEFIISNLPKFPIYYDETVIITPILFYLLNGFSNRIKEKTNLLKDFFCRIAEKIGVILASKYFFYPQRIHFDNTGIHDFFTNKLLKEPNVFKIQDWMVDKFDTNDFGWFSYNNHLMADYLFENFNIKKVAEFGIFMGYSTRIFLNKNPNLEYYCFDNFNPLFLTKSSQTNMKVDDVKFHWKFMRFETFHANIKEFKNVYTIVGDIYQNFHLLKKYNIEPDLFYIDFEKRDNYVIKIVDKILNQFPNTIIFGDDAVYLNKSLKYIQEKYNSIILKNCYACSKNKTFPDAEKFTQLYQQEQNHLKENNIKKVSALTEKFKINYITRLIDRKIDIPKILIAIDYLHINPNTRSITLENEDNIYHFICKKYRDDPNYYMKLYNELNKIHPDKGIPNNFNLIPHDYIDYNIGKF